MRSQVLGVCAVIVLLLFAMPGVMAAGTTGIMAEPLGNTVKDVGIKEPMFALEKIGVSPGKEFDYNVYVYNIRDLGNMDFKLNFDERGGVGIPLGELKYLKCSKVQKGSINSDSIFDYSISTNYDYWDASGYRNNNMRIAISFASSKAMSGSGTIAVIHCILDKDIKYPIPTKVDSVIANKIDGQRLMIDNRISGDIHYGRSIQGDCDSDGYASTRDALMIIQMSVGKISTDKGCDVNYDGRVDSGDARDILKIAQGKTVAIESGSNSGTGSEVRGSGTVFNSGEDLPIPLPNPQNLGIGGKGFDPIPIP